MKRIYVRTRHWVEEHEGLVMSLAFLVGFVFDWLTLQRIDRLFDSLALLSYLFLSAAAIYTLHLYWGGALRAKVFERVVPWLPAFIQFTFGGLMSGLVVFYSRSGSWLVSWPFLFILVGIFVGNELLKKYYLQLIFQTAILFFLLFLLSIFYVPILFGRMGTLIFLLSGLVSLAFIYLFVRLLMRARSKYVRASLPRIFGAVGAVFVAINLGYFLNIIPPLPLSLKDAGAYYLIERVPGGYRGARDLERCGFFCLREKIKLAPGQPAYAYSAVFAPTRLSTTVAHRWQYYDEGRGWVTSSVISFPINGGRDGGYRGYTMKAGVFPGKWRVDVVTGRGQVIGRLRFDILPTDIPVASESVPLL